MPTMAAISCGRARESSVGRKLMATEYTKGSSTIKVTGSSISRARVPLFRQMAPKSLPTSTISAEENSRRRSNFFSGSLLWGSLSRGWLWGLLSGERRGLVLPRGR